MTLEYLDHANNLTNLVLEMNNENHIIYMYKNIKALEETKVEAPLIDFGECYNKVKNHYNIKEDLLITIINNEVDKSIYGKTINRYSFSDPKTGKVLNTTNICYSSDMIIIKENLKKLIDELDDEKKAFINDLIIQKVDIFNFSDRFYNDICYYFDSPNKKDIPLRDRISHIFPNITLCDPGCNSEGVDLINMRAICECTFNDFFNNITLLNNIYGESLSQFINIINSANIKVFKCIKDIFNSEHTKKCIGGLFILILLIIQITCVIKFMINGFFYIKKHVYCLIESFTFYINKKRVTFKEPPIRKQTDSSNKINDKSQQESKIGLKTPIDNKHGHKYIKKTTGINKINIYDGLKKEKDILVSNNLSVHPSFEKSKKKLDIIQNYLNDFDENDFYDVIDKEDRSFKQYFYEKMMENQIFLNTFFLYETFKPITFKIISFVLIIELYFIVNALFYNEDYLSELFNSDKEDSFFSFVPRRINQFIYTSSIKIIILYLINFFFMEEEKLKKIFVKFKNDEMKVKHELFIIVREIKNKLIFYFI